ncbi:SoxR reducing system RseC family protein [Bathymodiolus thermophilus thioautotrophic gill symbiont]|uniref:Fis family transcriptional regulator n=1 Tax=Bathymodiolus thermophilus thioautotrophic gill symbiont TaxID=2360 RepID=A0A1J5TV85_9GAMM|nr:SoxR reducing system RseC family protein [Bathymodiolus thermophilus thioautotrophic gill symbiont]OIR24739.1 Fis family transcriptional regulator [Bathymodiolus thermophilus thioautotrophic gill symbiont]
MKEQFEVIEIENQTMKLKVSRSSGCHSCEARSGCGTGILANYFEQYTLFNKPLQSGATVGDFITLEISSNELFYRAFQLYMLPLLALFAGGMLGNMLYPALEGVQILLAFVGFFASLLLTKYFVK